MITLPADIQQDANWDGYSKDSATGSTNPNKESAMGFAEHQRIVLNAKALLVNLNYSDADQNANKAKKALMNLKEVYTSAGSTGVLYITKGIHQPYANPHLQVSVVENGEDAVLYHLDVCDDTTVTDYSGSQHFHWRGVRFSARVRNNQPSWAQDKFDCAEWPENVPFAKRMHKDRRNSISPGGLAGLNQMLQEAEAKRLQQSARDKNKNAILATVETKLKLKPERAGPQTTASFWKGEGALNFLTPNSKKVSCTLDGDYFVHTNGQRMKVT
jgi:hypothetical protein